MSTKASVIAAIEASLREAQGLPGWPAPTIDNAKVTPDALPHGGGVVMISADVTNAETITLTDFTGTEIVVLPVQRSIVTDVQWTLVASGPGGSVSADLAATVADAPPAPSISNATITPNVLPFGGGTVTIDAQVENATELKLNNAPVTLPYQEVVEFDKRWTLLAEGPGGTASVDFEVDVQDAPAPTQPVITIKPVGTTQVIIAPGFYSGDRYDRFQIPYIVVNAAGLLARMTASTRNISAGGTRPPWGFALPLTLTFDGVPVATTTTVATANTVVFDVPVTGRRGWYRTSITGAPASWSVYDYAAFFDDGSGAVPTEMPVVIGSYGLVHPYKGSSSENPTPIHVSAMVPSKFEAVTQPISLRECPSFSTDPRRDQLAQVQLAICRQDDKYRAVLEQGRILNTCNQQDYFYSDMSEIRPRFQMLDGARGLGTVICPTHFEVGTATPPGMGFVGNVYFCEPQRFGKIKQDGTVITLAGYRHKKPTTHWDDTVQNVDLIGDWSQIPAGRPRYFRKLWGLAWNSFTFRTDESAPPNPAEMGLKPHLTGVEAFLSDSLNDRIIKLKFDKDSHLVPAIVTEFFLGKETWDVVELGFESLHLAISVRQENRVVVVDMNGAVVSQFNTPNPEGLYYLPSSTTRFDGWLYYGSRTTKAIRKRHMTTGEDLLAADLTRAIDDNARFVKFAVSDGTFGPRGMIAVATWSNNRYGYPALYRPNGTEIDGWLWAGTARPGRQWVGAGDPAPGYPASVGIGFGRLVYGTAQEGAIQISKALPTDTPMSAMYFQGQREWYDRGLQLTHGHRGFGLHGCPQAWGISNPIDAFLEGNGHVRAA